jgi:hypothetical protein
MMDSVRQLELWRAEPKGDDMPEPSESVLESNRRAQYLVQQLKQLAEYGGKTENE